MTTIRANNHLYLAPISHNDTHDSSVVGMVGLSPKPYVWSDVSDDHIGSPNMWWDTYYEPEVDNPIYLYKKKTSSANQRFDVLDLHLSIQRGDTVVQSSKGRKWIVEEIKKKKTTKMKTPQQKAHQGADLVLTNDDGDVVAFQRNGGGGGVFRDPIYFYPGDAARFSNEQYKPLPTLLFSRRDWRMAHDTAHPGAFGDDYVQLSPSKVNQRHAGGDALCAQPWVAVWKFPYDLNVMDGFRPIYNRPLPVGRYRFYDDGWWVPPPQEQVVDPMMPINEIEVEKLRFDSLKDVPTVHYLEADDNQRVAMISSTHFIDAFWDVTSPEKKRVTRMLRDLYKVTGIYAFCCYSQHHAIVLYWDIKTNQRITPVHMARDILQNSARASAVLRVLRSGTADDHSLRPWARHYSDVMLQQPEEKDVVVGRRYLARIQTDGDYIEGKLVARVRDDGTVDPVDEKALKHELFALAQGYVKRKKLAWSIAMPTSWHTTSAHITLNRQLYPSDDVINQTFEVTLGDPDHFTTSSSRYVILPAFDLNPRFQCEYECHVSIGQQRLV